LRFAAERRLACRSVSNANALNAIDGSLTVGVGGWFCANKSPDCDVKVIPLGISSSNCAV
jgi:hypothetical protein